VDGMEKWLVHKGPEGLTYLSNVRWQGGGSAAQDHAMEHLSCFAAGWLALGSRHQTDQGRARRHMKLAEDIAETYAEKRSFRPLSILKTMLLPRQARDKHRESAQRQGRFLQVLAHVRAAADGCGKRVF
jgi:hypothetical protein